MLSRRVRINLSLLMGALLIFTFINPVYAAAPRLLMLYGKPLPKPIILDDWQENLKLMLAVTEASPISAEELKDRPYLKMAFFWGLEWDRYVKEGKPLDKLCPEDGNQHGRFYPAVGEAEAVFAFDNIPGPGPLRRRVKAAGLKILERHGIKVRVEARPAEEAVRAEVKSACALSVEVRLYGEIEKMALPVQESAR